MSVANELRNRFGYFGNSASNTIPRCSRTRFSISAWIALSAIAPILLSKRIREIVRICCGIRMDACVAVTIPFGNKTSKAYGARFLPSSFVQGSTVTTWKTALKPSFETTSTGRLGPACSLPTAGSRSAQYNSHRATLPMCATYASSPSGTAASNASVVVVMSAMNARSSAAAA